MIAFADSEEEDLLIAGAYRSYGESHSATSPTLYQWRGTAVLALVAVLLWLTVIAG